MSHGHNNNEEFVQTRDDKGRTIRVKMPRKPTGDGKRRNIRVKMPKSPEGGEKGRAGYIYNKLGLGRRLKVSMPRDPGEEEEEEEEPLPDFGYDPEPVKKQRKGRRGLKKGSQFTRKSGKGIFFSDILSVKRTIQRAVPKFGMYRVNGEAMRVLESIAVDLFVDVVEKADGMRKFVNKRTLGARDVESAVKLYGNSELVKHMITEMTKANVNAENARKKHKKGFHRKNKVTGINAYGLVINPGKIRGLIKTASPRTRVSVNAAVSIAALIEYTLAEIIELSFRNVEEYKAVRSVKNTHAKFTVQPVHILLVFKGDTELDEVLFSGKKMIRSSGGLKTDRIDYKRKIWEEIKYGE